MGEGAGSESRGRTAVSDRFLLYFHPETMSPARRLSHFSGPPFESAGQLAAAARAFENRWQRLEVLVEVANGLRSGLAADNEELEEHGFTPARRSRQYAALSEALFLELYACLDVVRLALFEAYRGIRGVQNKSTEKLFSKAQDRKYGDGFPEDVRKELASAYEDWFPRLRRIRTELTHRDVGSCSLHASGAVSYFHTRLGTGTPFVIDDLEAEVNQLATKVRDLTDVVFEHLCSRLGGAARKILCGMYLGRAYERTVSFSGDLGFHSGACASRNWFESSATGCCPMRHSCGAYAASLVESDNQLDWKALREWRKRLFEIDPTLLSSDLLLESQALDADTFYSDKIGWLHDVRARAGMERRDSLDVELARRLPECFPTIRGYHACKPADPTRLRDQGLRGRALDDLREEALSLFSELEVAREEILEIEEKRSLRDEEGRLFISLDDRDFSEHCGHYLIYGSEYLQAIAAGLHKSRGERPRRILRDRGGVPTIFVVELRSADIDLATRAELVRCMLSAAFQRRGEGDQLATAIDFTFVLDEASLPIRIADHYHPSTIRDPHARFAEYTPDQAMCALCPGPGSDIAENPNP